MKRDEEEEERERFSSLLRDERNKGGEWKEEGGEKAVAARR